MYLFKKTGYKNGKSLKLAKVLDFSSIREDFGYGYIQLPLLQVPAEGGALFVVCEGPHVFAISRGLLPKWQCGRL